MKPVPIVAAALFAAAGCSVCSAPPTPTVHIRGTLRAVSSKVITVATRSGTVRVQVKPPLVVRTLTRSNTSAIANGAFVGITSVPQPNGIQRAVEVHIFPESMRGAGEGTRAWDLHGRPPGSRMTNGAVKGRMPTRMTNGTVRKPQPSRMTNGTVKKAEPSRMTNGTVRRGTGSTVEIQYGGSAPGAQTIVIPPSATVVMIAPGTPAALKPGAHVFIMASRRPNGALTTSSVTVGLKGLVPPM